MSDRPRTKFRGCSPVLFPKSPLLTDLAGMPELRAWGEAFATDLIAYKAKSICWADVDPGLLVHGPPGTGKSTFAKALAASAEIPLVAASYAHWQRNGEGHMGDVLRAMHGDFIAAQAHAPCILAIDELDSIPSRTSGSDRQEWWTPVINALLEQLGGVIERPGIVVIGICNDASRLDPALIRAGRLDRQIYVPPPGAGEIPGILRFLLDDNEARRLGDLSRFGAACFGMTGADLGRLLRDARRLARSARRELQVEDVLAVLEPDGRDPEDDRRVALHEAGHALAAVRLGASKGLSISIMARAGVAGQTSVRNPARIQTRETVVQTLTVLLAGRAAEEVMLGSVSGGSGGDASSDLGTATRVALNAIANLGLGEGPSLLWYGAADQSPASLENQHPITRQVESLLSATYESTRKLIDDERAIVVRIADALVTKRALHEHEIIALVQERADGSQHG